MPRKPDPDYRRLVATMAPAVRAHRSWCLAEDGTPDPEFVRQVMEALREDRLDNADPRDRKYGGRVRRRWVEAAVLELARGEVQ